MRIRVTRGIGIILATIICIGLIPAAHADHRTNFLDALYSEVTNRVANPGTNTAAEKAGLRAASNILGRDTKTFSADLSALASAATVLNTRFPGDGTLQSLEENALAAYANEAFAELDGAKVRVESNTNSLPKGTVRQFIQATNALNRFYAQSNSLPQRARALAQVFNKARVPVMKIFHQFPNLAQAPETIATSLNLDFGFDFNTLSTLPTTYYCDTTSDGVHRSLTYFCSSPAEAGTWEYFKTGDKTARVRFTPSSPSGLGVHEFQMIFTTTRLGTFTGNNALGQAIQGNFLID